MITRWPLIKPHVIRSPARCSFLLHNSIEYTAPPRFMRRRFVDEFNPPHQRDERKNRCLITHNRCCHWNTMSEMNKKTISSCVFTTKRFSVSAVDRIGSNSRSSIDYLTHKKRRAKKEFRHDANRRQWRSINGWTRQPTNSMQRQCPSVDVDTSTTQTTRQNVDTVRMGL